MELYTKLNPGVVLDSIRATVDRFDRNTHKLLCVLDEQSFETVLSAETILRDPSFLTRDFVVKVPFRYKRYETEVYQIIDRAIVRATTFDITPGSKVSLKVKCDKVPVYHPVAWTLVSCTLTSTPEYSSP